jgi:hypothetical protein
LFTLAFLALSRSQIQSAASLDNVGNYNLRSTKRSWTRMSIEIESLPAALTCIENIS